MTPSVSSELSIMQQILGALAPLAVPGAAPALLRGRALCGSFREVGPLDTGVLVSRALEHMPCRLGASKTCPCGPGEREGSHRDLHVFQLCPCLGRT